MERALSIEAFVANPVGHYNVGATHVVWCHSPTFAGTAHFGRPSEQDASELIARLGLTAHPALAAGGFNVLMDAHAMETFEWPAFAVLSEYVRQQLEDWSRRIRRHAIIVPRGTTGAVVAGLLPLLGPEYPLRFFAAEERAQALEWLGRSDAGPILAEVDRIVDEARGVPALLRSLRDYLDGALVDATIEDAARVLGTSTRTLQRALHDHETQFTAELAQARVRAALQLLEQTDEKVDVIARQVGCSSASHLAQLVSRAIGETPAQYRARRR